MMSINSVSEKINIKSVQNITNIYRQYYIYLIMYLE
jgi:hypothetical protein